MGAQYCDEHKDRLVDDLGVTVGGVPQSLPRYYVKRLGDLIDRDRLEQRMIDRATERHKMLEERGIERLSEADYSDRQRAQNNKSLVAKVNLRKVK